MAPKSVKAKILPRRFELIKKMYISDKVIAANKKDLIFNWFFENFQNKTSSLTHELLWKTFYEILHLEKNQNNNHRILIKSNAVMNLVNAVTNFPFSNSWSSTILSSVILLLQTPTVNTALISDVDKLFLLLIGSLKIICKLKEDNSEDEESLKEAINLANIVLDILENLPASNNGQKALLLADNLKDLAVFMYIAANDVKLSHLNEKLAKKIISIVFNLKEKTFETLLTPTENSTAVERPNPNILQFFTSLQGLLMSEGLTHYSVLLSAAGGTLAGKLLSSFLNQNKSSLHSLKVASLFFAVSGLDIPIIVGATSCCKSLFKENISNVDRAVSALSYLLEACSTVPQYFTSVAVPAGYLKPSIWLKGVSAAMLDVKVSKSKAAWLKCFSSLLIISPSIIDSDILQLIKTALLNISVHTKESKKQYCELFRIVLQTHSKLHQLPKFFVKLLLALTECIKEDSGGHLLKNGQILPQALESIAKCVQDLPYGQMIELWKIFIETFSTLENMSQAFNVSKGFMFFVAQLFSNFLLHAQLFQANIPSNISSQFSSLIEATCDEIKKNISALKDTDYKIIPFQSSILLLCYAVGEVKFLYSVNLGEIPDTAKHPVSDDVFDFSVIHSYLDQSYSSILRSFVNGDEKILSYLVFQLMLQKIRVLDFCSKFSNSENHTENLQKMIPDVLQYLQDNSSATESWDLDMCTLNTKNCGSAFWMSILKISRLFLSHLQPKDVYIFCSSAQDIILQDNGFENGAKSFILSSLRNGDFEDFKHFQTAFVSSIWRQSNLLYTKKRLHDDMEAEETLIDRIFTLLNGFKRKSLKYAERTPKSDKNLGSMWNEIKEIADHLNNILSSEALPKDKIIIKNFCKILELINTLPLQYLLPGNQMKSIMGLSLMFFLIPQSCSADEAVKLSKEISQLLLIIFEGARSIWLFDFIATGPYLKFVVKTVESVLSDKFDDDHGWAIQLFEHLIALAVKTADSVNGLENFISEVASKNNCSKSVLIIMYSLMKKLSQVLSHPHKQEKYQETLTRISSLILQAFIEQMRKSFNNNIKNTYHYYFIKCYIQAIEMICSCPDLEKFNRDCCEFLPAVLENAVNIALNSNINTLRDVYMTFISKVCKYSSKLSTYLPQGFIDLSWKIVLSHFEHRRKMKTTFFEANQNLKNYSSHSSGDIKSTSCVLCSAYLDYTPSVEKNRTIDSVDLNDDESFLSCNLNQFEQESLKELSTITSLETLSDIFLNLMKEMDCFHSATKDLFSLQFSLLMCHCLIDANVEKCMQPSLNNLIQKLLSQLQYTINQACGSLVCHTMVIIPILNFIDFIIKGNKGLSKQTLLQNLHCIVVVPLEVKDDDYNLFISSFDAVWKVIYDLYMHHTSLVLASPAPFLYYVSKLLKALVRAGSSTSLSKCDPKTFQQLQLCGQNMDRLLTVISRNKNEFSKLVPYLVADYVDAVQHITLDSGLKESILSGIYRLLDICSDQAIKMLAVNINYVCREIYTNLVKNYRQTKQIIA